MSRRYLQVVKSLFPLFLESFSNPYLLKILDLAKLRLSMFEGNILTFDY